MGEDAMGELAEDDARKGEPVEGVLADEASADEALADEALADEDDAEEGRRRRGYRMAFVDADACPVTREALDVARRVGVAVTVAGNSTQNLERRIRPSDPRSPETARRGFWVGVLDVSVGADSADFAIVERLEPGDVVVTQDIGLASMVLGRGARAIGVRGRVYDPLTIDAALMLRHEEKKVRRAGGRTKGPDPFTDEDRDRFVRNFERLLRE